MRGSRGLGDRGSGPSLKNHKNIGFPSNTGPDPIKVECWAILGTPAKWRFAGGPMMVR